MGLPPTSSKISSDANNVTTFFFQFPNFTGSHTGATLSLGINSVAGGGTGLATLTANNVILGNGTSSPTFVAPGASGNVLKSNGTTWTSAAASGGNPFDFFASSKVNTISSTLTANTFTTFSNSPAFTFTPNYSGTYKVYGAVPFENIAAGTFAARVFNTSGGATLLQENQAPSVYPTYGTNFIVSAFVQSVYTLTSGTTYVFDVQGTNQNSAGAGFALNASEADFYMFAERVG